MSCLFTSLLAASGLNAGGGGLITHVKLRNQLVDFIEEHVDEYKEHATAASEGALTFRQYCARMRSPATMGDFTMICAAAQKFHWCIFIHIGRHQHVVCFYEQNERNVHIRYTPGHYEPLLIN